MASWVIRGGREGEREDYALANSVAAIGWEELPDLSSYSGDASMRKLVEQHYPDLSPQQRGAHWPQLLSFAHEIAVGDWVLMPLHREAAIKGTVGEGGRSKLVAIGRVSAAYRYGDHGHALGVDWRNQVPIFRFAPDLRGTLTLQRTVIPVTVDAIDERLSAIAARSLHDGYQPDGPLDGFTEPTALNIESLQELRDAPGVHVI